MKRALLFGASGFVGSYLLKELLESPDYSVVTVVARRDLGIYHSKLKLLVSDFEQLNVIKKEIIADDVFITLGTTKKRTPDRKSYYQIDHDFPVLAARIGKERGAKSVFLLTAVGADPRSKVFYIRTKGETERDVIAESLDFTHIFRPSMILGKREEFRLLERMAIRFWPVPEFFFRLADKTEMNGIHAADIARAMIRAAGQPAEKVNVYHWKEMQKLISGPDDKR